MDENKVWTEAVARKPEMGNTPSMLDRETHMGRVYSSFGDPDAGLRKADQQMPCGYVYATNKNGVRLYCGVAFQDHSDADLKHEFVRSDDE